MKKCNRCHATLNWNRSYCPVCGGYAADAPAVSRVVPAAPAVEPSPAAVAAPKPEPLAVSEEILRPEEILQPAEIAGASISGIEHGATAQSPAGRAIEGERLEISDEIDVSAGAVFQRSGSASQMPSAPAGEEIVPQEEPMTGEFLKMFPDAKPD